MGAFATGQVAMLLFPFSDLSRNKLRPAVLLAKASRQDWIVCQITSSPFGDPGSFLLSTADFATGTLDHSSYVRPGKVFTAHESLIAGVVGILTPDMLETIRRAVINVIQGA